MQSAVETLPGPNQEESASWQTLDDGVAKVRTPPGGRNVVGYDDE